ncbi:extracellular solute-binding protein [Ruminiclostridium herbifermentans]|uniref:Extracellular solute-binding protein n=1 Tax=Ruminiclostridium herbifermentans TaxID=2488810 RepID=A0A4U7JEZ3_9FIRM|nr:extracellular solute-binding protein [Ruminiclostridium herbifermentans]QNU67340.1 extracellular solute-binding protein [Ruminiclostridium herbifermentans]
MKIKKYISMILLILILASTASCSDKNTETSGTKDSKAVITMDVLSNDRYILAAIGQFNEEHKDIRIEYGDIITYNEEYKNKYITRLSVGEGPDIIRVDNELGLLTAVHKTADAGIFYDLNELINKDNSFNLSDYNQKVMNSGVINGKRFLIPLRYNFSTFFAKKGVLKENGFTTDGEKYTLENFADEVYAFMQKNKGTGKYFMTLHNFTLSDIVKISGLSLIDINKKTAKLNSAEFVDLLNIYKKLHSVETEISKDIRYYVNTGDIFACTVECPDFDNGNCLIMNNMDSIFWSRDRINKVANTYIFPQYTNKKSILLEPILYLAINSKCKYKQEAFEFIKLLLTEEYQKADDLKGFYSLAVNNNAYLNNVNFYISNLDNAQPIEGEYDAEKRKEQVREQYQEIQEISVCDTVDAQVYDIIDSEAKNFIDGKRSAEKTAEIIQDKVMLYLNE